jgi:hypothetical protein
MPKGFAELAVMNMIPSLFPVCWNEREFFRRKEKLPGPLPAAGFPSDRTPLWRKASTETVLKILLKLTTDHLLMHFKLGNQTYGKEDCPEWY